VELPTFPHTVVYQQAATAPQAPADLSSSVGDRGGAALLAIADPEVSVRLPLLEPKASGPLVLMVDVLQVGRENPSELKAAKLARSMARGVEDRDLKPNTKERQQIEAVIRAPPNRSCMQRLHLRQLAHSTSVFLILEKQTTFHSCSCDSLHLRPMSSASSCK
jgi:phosphatidylinositol 3-kinase